MSKAAELAALIGGQQAQGNRNLIINGAMTVDQRNSGSAVSAPHNTYTLDRLNVYQSGDGAYSVQQVSDVVPDGFANSAKIACTTADTNGFGANDYYMLTHNFEYNQTRSLEFGTSSAKQVTLSFYVRSNLTGTFSGALESGDGGRHYVFEYTINSANTFERKSITIPGDTSGTWTGTFNATGMKIRLALALGANYDGTAGTWGTDESYGSTNQTNFFSSTSNVFYITGLQLEIGGVATPFEHRSYSDELARCQRYTYIMSSSTSSATTEFINGAAYSASQVNAGIDLPVTMRATPTVTYGNDTGAYRFYRAGSNDAFDTLVNDNPTNLHLQFAGTAGLSHTSGVAGSVQLRYADGAFVKADAEL
tara:strand:- start:204 stop:1298 length:1095 start_codon:yes stop_codon:yes gene_type:complete